MGKRDNTWLNRLGKFGLIWIVLILGACGKSEHADSASGESIQEIGILLSAEHSALTSAQKGFIEELERNDFVDGENVAINVLNAQGSSGNLHDMAQKLADERDRLLGSSITAAQAIPCVTDDILTLFTATTDTKAGGLIESVDALWGDITGTRDMVPVEEQIELLISIIPEPEKIGIIFNSSEPNSQVQADFD